MSDDTLLHRLVRPATVRLSRTSVRPNHLTALRLASALGSAISFAAGTRGWIVAGSVLFAVSFLLDRMDGELARATGRTSRLGHVIDLAADCASNALIFLGMGVGARHGWLHAWAPVLGCLAAACVPVLFWRLNHNSPSSRLHQVARLVDADDAMLLVPVLTCVAGLAPVLLLAGILTPLAAIATIVIDAIAAPGIPGLAKHPQPRQTERNA